MSEKNFMQGGFYFIASVLDIKIDLPVEITPDMRIDKANPAQIEVIRQFLGNADSAFFSAFSYYEQNSISETNGGITSYKTTPLPEKDWRYYVINYTGYNYKVVQCLYVADLLYPNIASFMHGFTDEPFGQGNITGRGLDPAGTQAFYGLPVVPLKQEFNQKNLGELQEIIRLHSALDKQRHEGILRAIEFHYNLKRLTQLNRLTVLGHFAVIEMLLTHNPNDKEVGDSLTHQLKTKVALLSRVQTQFNQK